MKKSVGASEQRTAEILRLYNTRQYSTSEIADQLGVSQPTVYNQLKRLRLGTSELPRRYRAPYKAEFTEVEKQEIIQLHGEGKFVTEIAVALEKTIGPVRRAFRELALEASTQKRLAVGGRFGALIVLGTAPGRMGPKGFLQATSAVRCDCGKELVVINHVLRCRNTTSCGCKIHRKNPDSIWIRIRLQIENNARKRGLTMPLSNAQLRIICSLPCLYCGMIGSNRMKGRRGGRSTPELIHAYNGIDRVDSTLGYVLGNIVPCCRSCNRSKSNASLTDFLGWLRRHGSKLRETDILSEAELIGHKLQRSSHTFPSEVITNARNSPPA